MADTGSAGGGSVRAGESHPICSADSGTAGSAAAGIGSSLVASAASGAAASGTSAKGSAALEIPLSDAG
jgi:hypothetical protein